MLSSFYHPLTAGSEVFTKEISERLAKDGHEVIVVTGQWGKGLKFSETIKGVKVIRTPSVLRSNLALPSVTPGMLIEGIKAAKGADVIHAHLAFPPGFVGAKIKKITGIPLVTTVQGGDMGIYPESGLGRFWGIARPMISFGLRNADKVTSISTYLSEKAKLLGAKDIVMVRNGTDTKTFNPNVNTDTIKNKYGLKEGPKIVSVSRLVPKNGTEVLLTAFKRVLSELPTAELIIAGDGEQMRELKGLAKELKIADNVSFLGYVPHEEIPAFMALADVFCRLSHDEGLGIVFAEAMACKTPVVATDVGGIPDVVDCGKTGLLVAPGDPNAAADAILKILKDNKYAKDLSEAAYHKILSEFSWDSIYAKMFEIYEELANKRSRKQ